MNKIAGMVVCMAVIGLVACGIAVAGPLENADEAVQVAVQEAEQHASSEPTNPDIEWDNTSRVIDPNTGKLVDKQNKQQDQENPSNW